MNLLAIRTSLAKKSGRYDLVNPTTYADTGMDFHINAGEVYLNGISEAARDYAHLFNEIVEDEYSVTFAQKCREISSVWVHTGSTRSELEYIKLEDIETTYDAAVLSAATGTPAYYTHATYRMLAEVAATTLDNFIHLEWPTEDYTEYEFQGIITLPPSDATYTITTAGKFLPAPLSGDTDINYWSENYPNLLEMAALRSIEVFNRNTAGVNDWTNAIMAETVLLDFDPGDNYDTDYTSCD